MTDSVEEVEPRRTSPRKKVVLWAKACRPDGCPAIRCIIRDASTDGCQIVTRRVDELPDEFALEIAGLAKPFQCRVVWRSDRAAGVRFQ